MLECWDVGTGRHPGLLEPLSVLRTGSGKDETNLDNMPLRRRPSKCCNHTYPLRCYERTYIRNPDYSTLQSGLFPFSLAQPA
jgi:hypothetical protein